MNSLREKHVVINLVIVPMIKVGPSGTQTSGKIRQSRHVDDARRVPGREAETDVCCQWIDSFTSRGGVGRDVVETKPQGIHQGAAEQVSLLESYELPFGLA